MKKLTIVLSVLIALVISSCSTGASKKEGNIHLSGNLENLEGKKLSLDKFVNGQPELVDTSIVAEDGSFDLALTSENGDFYRLSTSPQNVNILILSPDQNITITGDGADLSQGLSVEGSEDTELLWSYYSESKDFGLKSQEIRSQAQAFSQGDPEHQALVDEFNLLSTNFISFTKEFITDHSNSLAVFSALGNLNIETDSEYFIIARDGLKADYSNTNMYKSLDQQIQQYIVAKQKSGMFDPGSEVPNITQNDPTGKARSLYDLRGEVVLIDFWASWCRPCRAENPNVVRLYNKYHKDGFDIFSVSLDKTQDKWVAAIKADGLVWPNHVSDLKYWSSEAAQLYNVRSIPFTVLLDREGRVIGTKLRGQQLEATLKEIFGY